MEIRYQLKPALMGLLVCIEAQTSRRNTPPIHYQKKKIYMISLVFLILQIKVSGPPAEPKKYLEESLSDSIPKAFAPKTISPKGTDVFGAVLSKKADELFYAIQNDLLGPHKTH